MAGGGDGEDRSGKGGGGEEPEERTDGWMTSYSDLVTLLMTFFVLMFAISNVDSSKASLLFAALSRDGLTAEQFMELQEPFDFTDDPYSDSFPIDSSHTTDPDDGQDAGGEELGNEQLTLLYEAIGGYINNNGLGDRLSLMFDGEFILLTLANDIWFVSGRADITAQMRDSASEIALLLAETFDEKNPFVIVVDGHTDNVPVNYNSQYRSNWNMSMDRASNFIELLITISGLDPYYFQARGNGEYHPIDTNDTDEGRQANRRVEVKISLALNEDGSAVVPRSTSANS